uniref:Uncharacterized protein n=1 Tax=Oryza rufipogon TaxID=4529 RepID=A0A0E0PW58_ORYRU
MGQQQQGCDVLLAGLQVAEPTTSWPSSEHTVYHYGGGYNFTVLSFWAPFLAIEDTVLHGHRVAAGTRVMINAWAIGRDEAAWEGAAEFRPGRFAGGGDAAGVEYYGGGGDFRFMPFGAGRRGSSRLLTGAVYGEQ